MWFYKVLDMPSFHQVLQKKVIYVSITFIIFIFHSMSVIGRLDLSVLSKLARTARKSLVLRLPAFFKRGILHERWFLRLTLFSSVNHRHHRGIRNRFYWTPFSFI